MRLSATFGIWNALQSFQPCAVRLNDRDLIAQSSNAVFQASRQQSKSFLTSPELDSLRLCGYVSILEERKKG
jgi:hypothetical protein